MTLPSVVMCSMWRNDEDRQLLDRAMHLLSKCESYPALRWLWVVGDSSDRTAERLGMLCGGYSNIRVVDIGDTGIKGDDMPTRLRRLSVTANHYFKYVDGADYVLIHESDIVSPPNVVNLLVANAERGICPVAAWPTLEVKPGHKLLYDVWALRKDGKRFNHTYPYHPCYKADKPFVVDSAGTVLLMHAEDSGSVLMDKHAVLDLCWHLRELGRDIWVDPTIEVVQPHSLWEYHRIEKVA